MTPQHPDPESITMTGEDLLFVTYHYVRDLPRTRHPRIKGILTDAFREQVDGLRSRFEMATWESIDAFLRGAYAPTRPLCHLTFDDGLTDHFHNVLPILAERKIEGTFFVSTRCPEEDWVTAVHKNHFLMATMPFKELFGRFVEVVQELDPDLSLDVDEARVREAHRWDRLDVATYKYLLNFVLPVERREQILSRLFADVTEDEAAFARELYLSWPQLRELRDAGMTVGGHSHCHHVLSRLSREARERDLRECHDLLVRRLGERPYPFSYPGGLPSFFTPETVEQVKACGFSCAFTTTTGVARAGDDRFTLRRVDTRHADRYEGAVV